MGIAIEADLTASNTLLLERPEPAAKAEQPAPKLRHVVCDTAVKQRRGVSLQGHVIVMLILAIAIALRAAIT